MNDRKVAAENKRLMALFTGVDEHKLDFVREHVRQLAWHNCRIAQLQRNIDEKGITVPFQNGKNQTGLQSNPDLKALIDLQKLANAMVKTLLPLVPEKQISGKLAMLRMQEELFSFEEDEEFIKEQAQRDREYEERRKKAEEDFQRAVEQQRREREQREKERAGQSN